MRSSSTTPARPRQLVTAVLGLIGVLAALVLQAPAASAAPATVSPGPEIEAFAPYQGQSTCDPVARDGAIMLRDLVLASYPGTGDSGITRACSVGGTSEHKEGRAWDWRVSTANPEHVAQVADLMEWLLATDEHGNAAAMARRLGIMYMIWDSQVWKSYQAAKGWQPYVGASPHTDHVHFSLSWAGGYGATSYWTGTVAPTMYAPVKEPAPTTSPSPTGSTESTSDTATATVGTTPSPVTVVDRRVQSRMVKGSLPGPWRRH